MNNNIHDCHISESQYSPFLNDIVRSFKWSIFFELKRYIPSGRKIGNTGLISAMANKSFHEPFVLN
jgi:hypothetical protein